MAVLLIVLLAFAAATIYGGSRFERLIRIEYETAREAWIADGKPKSSFWWAPGEDGFQNHEAGQLLQLKLVFNTPRWVQDNTKAMQYLRQYRLCGAAWGLVVVSSFVYYAMK
jgi:hypothetical protein